MPVQVARSKLAGIVTDVRDVDVVKRYVGRPVSPAGRVIDVRAVHSLNGDAEGLPPKSPKLKSPDGRVIDVNDVQRENTP